MKARTMWVVVAVVMFLVLAAGAAGAIPALLAPGDPVAGTINYQGRLTDPGGVPLDGTFPMRFQVYDDPAAGVIKWDSGVVNVGVDNGLFNVGLDVDPYHFNGQGLWLRINVNGEWLSPRQDLLPVPYALSLKPGAQIWGSFDRNWLLKVKNSANPATGAAIWGEAATGMAVYGTSPGGYGLHGYTENGYAVSGTDAGATQANGYGGYFTSMNGVGVYGYSSAALTANNFVAPGVFGKSLNGVGVYGVSEGTNSGVRGENTTSGRGVYGRSYSGRGVSGYSGIDIGVHGQTGGGSGDYGVYGTGGNSTYGVYGYKSGTGGGLGVYGQNDGSGSGVSGNSVEGVGTWGWSANYDGVHGATGAADNNYGLHTADNLYSLNFHTLGATMQVVQNGDAEPLEPGDVVAIAGLGDAPAEGLPRVIRVRKASEAGSTAVLGVVLASYAKERLTTEEDSTGASGPDGEVPLSEAKPVAPGDYLLVVVRGPCQVKASAVGGAIRVGDLLVTAGLGGYAARAPEVLVEGVAMAAPGTVLGKALESLDAGDGLIYVYVTLQ